MIKIDRDKLKNITKMCILEEKKICDNCCECFVCDIDPTKTCDNCAKCLKLAEYNSIVIDDILLTENPFTYRNERRNSKGNTGSKVNTNTEKSNKNTGKKGEAGV